MKRLWHRLFGHTKSDRLFLGFSHLLAGQETLYRCNCGEDVEDIQLPEKTAERLAFIDRTLSIDDATR